MKKLKTKSKKDLIFTKQTAPQDGSGKRKDKSLWVCISDYVGHSAFRDIAWM